jgi:hypothetical protein
MLPPHPREPDLFPQPRMPGAMIATALARNVGIPTFSMPKKPFAIGPIVWLVSRRLPRTTRWRSVVWEL